MVRFVGTGILSVEIRLFDGFGNEVCGFLSGLERPRVDGLEAENLALENGRL